MHDDKSAEYVQANFVVLITLEVKNMQNCMKDVASLKLKFPHYNMQSIEKSEKERRGGERK